MSLHWLILKHFICYSAVWMLASMRFFFMMQQSTNLLSQGRVGVHNVYILLHDVTCIYCMFPI